MKKGDIVNIGWVGNRKQQKETLMRVSRWDTNEIHGNIISNLTDMGSPGFFYWTEIKSIETVRPVYKDGDWVKVDGKRHVRHKDQWWALTEFTDETIGVDSPKDPTVEESMVGSNDPDLQRRQRPVGTVYEAGSEGDWCGR